MKPSTYKLLEQISQRTKIPIHILEQKFRERSIRAGVPFDDYVELYVLTRAKVRENEV